MLLLPGLLSPEAQARPPWPAVPAVSPRRPQGPGRGTPGCGTGGPGGEQMSLALASQAHLPSRGQTPQEEGPAHTSLVHGTRSGATPGAAPRAEGAVAGASWDASPRSSSHPRGGHGVRGPGCRPLSPHVLPAAPEKLGASLLLRVPQTCVSRFPLVWRRLGCLRAVDESCLPRQLLCGELRPADRRAHTCHVQRGRSGGSPLPPV